MAGEMALIDETYMVGNFADRELACGQKFLRFFHPGIDDILVRRLARRLFEQPGEVIGTHVDSLSNPGNSQICSQTTLTLFDSAHQLIARQPVRLPSRTY